MPLTDHNLTNKNPVASAPRINTRTGSPLYHHSAETLTVLPDFLATYLFDGYRNGSASPHIRHLYKYLDVPLPPDNRFTFRTEKGHLGIQAASLYELSRLESCRAPLSTSVHWGRHR